MPFWAIFWGQNRERLTRFIVQSSLCEIILGESTFDLQNVAVSALLIKTMVLVLCWAGADTTVLLTSGRKSAVSLCPVQRRRRFPHFISACVFLDYSEELRQAGAFADN